MEIALRTAAYNIFNDCSPVTAPLQTLYFHLHMYHFVMLETEKKSLLLIILINLASVKVLQLFIQSILYVPYLVLNWFGSRG